MKSFISGAGLLIVVVAVLCPHTTRAQAASGEGEDSYRAERAWDALIVRKGGRERLHAISNILIRANLPRKNGLLNVLHVFPDRIFKFAYWADGKPNLLIIDGSRNVIRSSVRGEPITNKSDSPLPDSWRVERVVYLLETKWDRPEPLRVTRQRIGKEQFDVVEVSFKGYRLEYFFDPEEMLVRRVVFHRDYGRTVYDFSDYLSVAGIQLPQKEGLGINDEKYKYSSRLEFQFNVDYDPLIFTGPVTLSPDGWKVKR